MSENQTGSFNPNDAKKTGFMEGWTVELTQHRVIEDGDFVFLNVIMTAETTQGKKEYSQKYIIGSKDSYHATNDGKGFSGAKIKASCPAMMYLTECIQAGFPANRLKGDVSVLDGCVAEMTNIPQSNKPVKAGEKQYMIIVPRLLELPGEEKVEKKSKSKGKAKKEDPPVEDVSDFAKEVVGAAIVRLGGKCTFNALVIDLFTAMQGEGEKGKQVMKLLEANDKAFIKENFKLDGSNVSLT